MNENSVAKKGWRVGLMVGLLCVAGGIALVVRARIVLSHNTTFGPDDFMAGRATFGQMAAQHRRDFDASGQTGMGVFLAIFGLIGLGFRRRVLSGQRGASSSDSSGDISDTEGGIREAIQVVVPPAPTAAERLRELEELRAKGLLASWEFDEKRREILKSL